MDLAVEQHEQARIVRIRGDVRFEDSDTLRSALLQQISPGTPTLIVDCGDMTFIGSAGLAALLAAHQAARAAGGHLRLAALRPQIRELLSVARLDAILPVYPSVAEALAGDSKDGRSESPR